MPSLLVCELLTGTDQDPSDSVAHFLCSVLVADKRATSNKLVLLWICTSGSVERISDVWDFSRTYAGRGAGVSQLPLSISLTAAA